MDIEHVHDVVRQFLRDLGHDADELPVAANLDDLGVDSLSLVDLLFRVEREFGIEIPDEALPEISTVGDLMNFVAVVKRQ